MNGGEIALLRGVHLLRIELYGQHAVGFRDRAFPGAAVAGLAAPDRRRLSWFECDTLASARIVNAMPPADFEKAGAEMAPNPQSECSARGRRDEEVPIGIGVLANRQAARCQQRFSESASAPPEEEAIEQYRWRHEACRSMTS